MNLQPTNLQNDIVKLLPLEIDDFEALFSVAADPLLWEQHPNKDRYKKEVFTDLFNESIASGSAFKIIDPLANEIVGSSRYYNFSPEKSEISIGYTYIARKYWASNFNRNLKEIMLNYAFENVNNVLFHVGITNFRSQKAVEKLGAIKIGEIITKMPNSDELKVSFEYKLKKSDWPKNTN